MADPDVTGLNLGGNAQPPQPLGENGFFPNGENFPPWAENNPQAWTNEVGFAVKKHWKQKPPLLKMKQTPSCIKNLSRINKVYFEEAIVQREKARTICAITDSREAIHFTAEKIVTKIVTDTGDEEEEITVLLKDPRNSPVLQMKITDLGRLYFTRRCTRAIITYCSEDDLIFTFKEISSNMLISTRYVYRLYPGIVNDDESDEEEEEEEEDNEENNNDETIEADEQDGLKAWRTDDEGKASMTTKSNEEEDMKKSIREKTLNDDEGKDNEKPKDGDDEEEDDDEDNKSSDGRRPREMVEIQRHGFLSCARAGGTVELIYADGSSETSEISDTDHDCFRIHYRLVLGFPRSADPVTKTLLIAGMILSSPRILRYVADL